MASAEAEAVYRRTVARAVVGRRLTNGAIVVAAKPATGQGEIVLALRNAPYEPWITWVHDPKGHCYSGHYFDDFDEAVEDYRSRS